MKQSMAVISAAAVVAMAKPEFLNSSFDITPGKAFQLKYSGCQDGCDIVLVNGDSKNLNDVQTLVKGADGESAEITLSDSFPKDTYALKLVPNDGGKPNYSIQFEFEGSGEAPAESETSSAAETTSMMETTTESSTVEETTTVTSMEETTTVTKATPTPESSSTETETETETPSNTTEQEEEPTETDSDGDDAPDSGASSLAASSLTLFAAAAGLVAYIL